MEMKEKMEKNINEQEMKNNSEVSDDTKNVFITDDTISKNKEDLNQNLENIVENNVFHQNEPSPDEKLTKLQLKYNELNDKHLRLAAEFDNYRKRTLKEKMELIKTAGEEILVSILPVVDNMERAIKSMNTATDVNAVKEGIDLIYNKFKEFLANKGIKEIESNNIEFNPDLHEAITKTPAPSDELKGKVIDTIEKGYYLHDKIVRFAKVIVGE